METINQIYQSIKETKNSVLFWNLIGIMGQIILAINFPIVWFFGSIIIGIIYVGISSVEQLNKYLLFLLFNPLFTPIIIFLVLIHIIFDLITEFNEWIDKRKI